MQTGHLPYDEKQLLQSVGEGDESAFRELLGQYHALCYSIAFKVLQDSWMAEDMVQEVFLSVWLRREQLPAIDNFAGWLRTVTANRLYDYLKKKKAEAARIQHWWAETRDTARSLSAATADEQEFLVLIEQAIGTLSPRQQQVFRLIKQEGYSREEAARLTALSPNTVKTHLDQAMRSVRAYCLGKLHPSTLSLLVILLAEKKI